MKESWDPFEMAACRTLFNLFSNVPVQQRQQATTIAMDLVDTYMGRHSQMYRAILCMHTVCVVHDKVNAELDPTQTLDD